MKLAIFLMMVVPVMALARDPLKQGDLADVLALSVRFAPVGRSTEKGEGAFVVELANVTGRAVKVNICTNAFLGTFNVQQPTGEIVSFYQALGRRILLTGMPMTSVLPGPAHGVVFTWTIPIADLCTLHEDHVSIKDLEDREIFVELKMIAVVPENEPYLSSNAAQTSNKIKISVEQAAPAKGAAPRH